MLSVWFTTTVLRRLAFGELQIGRLKWWELSDLIVTGLGSGLRGWPALPKARRHHLDGNIKYRRVFTLRIREPGAARRRNPRGAADPSIIFDKFNPFTLRGDDTWTR
jgi:hypothetical protein